MRRWRGAMAAAVPALALAHAGCLDAYTQCDGYVCPANRMCHPSGVGCTDPIDLECGDGLLVSPEACEPTDLGGLTCRHFGFYEADGLACSDACAIDTTACIGFCGDGVINGPELCDTTAQNARTCFETGYDYGSPTCGDTICAPIYDSCEKIGWETFAGQWDYVADWWAPAPGAMYLALYGDSITRFDGPAAIEIATPTNCYADQVWASIDGHVFVPCADVTADWALRSIAHHDGTGWQEYAMPAGADVNDLWGRSATDVYAVGDVVRHFDGATWTDVTIAAVPADTEFYAIHGNDAGTLALESSAGLVVHEGGAWMVETMTNVGGSWVSPGGTIYATDSVVSRRTAPSTWTPMPLPTAGAVYQVWGTSDRDVYAFEFNQLWHHDGIAWREVMLPDANFFASGIGGSRDHLAAVYDYGYFHETSGHLWTVPVTLQQLPSAVWAFSSIDVVAIDALNVNRFDGVSWTTTPAPSPAIDHVWGSPDRQLVGVGYNGVRFRHDGDGWIDDSAAVAIDFTDVHGTSSDNVFVTAYAEAPASRGEIHHWNGSTWSVVYQAPMGSSQQLGPLHVGDGGVYTTLRNPHRLLHLPPGGDLTTAWVEESLPVDSAVNGLWADADTVIVTYANRQSFIRDNGTWREVPNRVPVEGARGLTGSANDLFGSAGAHVVRWDGETWDRIRLPADFIGYSPSVFAGNGTVVVVAQTSASDGVVSQLIRPAAP